MKHLCSLVVLFFISLVAFGQNLPTDQNTSKVTFIEVVDASGLTDKDIFPIAKEFGTSKNFAVKNEDAEAGTVVYYCTIPVEYESVKPGRRDKGLVKFTYSVFCKNGKYRYIATDFVHEGMNGAGSGGKLESVSAECGKDAMLAKSWVTIKNLTLTQVTALNDEFKKKVKQVQNDPAKRSDW